MITKYDNYRNNELLRAVDTNPNASELEIELAKRLEDEMYDGDFGPKHSNKYVGEAK